jgi:hypothetical protein
LAKTKDAETTALATTVAPNAKLAVAEGADRNDRRGKENIDTERLILPRIAGAQKTSPEVDETSDKYIPGLKLFQMFNSLTGDIYGNGPLKFAVIRKLPFKAMQFDENNNVIDFNVAQGDERLKFTTGADGKRVKPIATEFREYLVILEDGSIAALSFKSTQNKIADKLDSFLNFRPGASWMGLYSLTSQGKTFAKGAATQFNVLPAGPTPATIVELAEQVFLATEKREIAVDNKTEVADDFTNAEGENRF